jgi:PPOX class probable F420-dependent enzyme
VNPQSAAAFASLGSEAFVSLTTFRRTGEPVSTPVWIARDGECLVVTTPEESGKVKRLHNDSRVELRPCNRMGKVEDGAVTVQGTASILADEASVARLTRLIRAKYRLEYHLVTFIERVVARRTKPRVILRITDAS